MHLVKVKSCSLIVNIWGKKNPLQKQAGTVNHMMLHSILSRKHIEPAHLRLWLGTAANIPAQASYRYMLYIKSLAVLKGENTEDQLGVRPMQVTISCK